jgi:hypothetical protein
MTETSHRQTSPWVAFLAGAVVMLAVALLVFGWQRGERLAEGVVLSLRDAPHLPRLPQLPDAPRLPGAPIPQPK